jgi:hypothetical protein
LNWLVTNFNELFYVFRDLRAADMVLGLSWLDDDHASLQFGTTRVFTLMNGTTFKTQIEERRPECLPILSTKAQKLMRKTRRSRGCNAEFYVIEVTLATDQPTAFHTSEELIGEQRANFRPLIR